MASASSSISSSMPSSISVNFLENSIDKQINNFFSLSKNLTPQEKAEGGKEYQLLNKLFTNRFAVNEAGLIQNRGFVKQSWPEIQRDGVSVCFLGCTLLDYLKGIESYSEDFLAGSDSLFTQTSEFEVNVSFPSRSHELSKPSTLMTRIVRVLKPTEGAGSQSKYYSIYDSLDRSSEFLTTEFSSRPPLKGISFNDLSSFKLEGNDSSSNIVHKISSRSFDKEEI